MPVKVTLDYLTLNRALSVLCAFPLFTSSRRNLWAVAS